MDTPPPFIRPAVFSDLPQIIRLCADHAAYERSDYQTYGKAEQLAGLLFGDAPAINCLVVEGQFGLIGYATYTIQFSTWDADQYGYLDCLYLDEEARNRGIGGQLMHAVKSALVNKGINSMQWQTPEFNVDAIRFYERLGGVRKTKERFFWHT